MEELVKGVFALRDVQSQINASQIDDKAFMDSNDIYKEKKQELDRKVGQQKDVKRQIDHIKKSFVQDSNYEWMNETQNKVKTNKKTRIRIRSYIINKVLDSVVSLIV